MKALRLGLAFAVLGMVGALPAAPARASDQALQAILQQLRCVPSKVVKTELATGVFSYEITCIGRADLVYVVCQGPDCRQQAKRRDGQEQEPPS